MLAILRLIKSVIYKILGYNAFDWNLFSDRARWVIAWSNYSANMRGSSQIDTHDLKTGLLLANDKECVPEHHGPALPFSKSAKEVIEKSWEYKNKLGDKYFYTTHLSAMINDSQLDNRV